MCVCVSQPVTANYLTAGGLTAGGPAQYAAVPVIPASLAAAAAVCSPLQAAGSVLSKSNIQQTRDYIDKAIS